MPVVLNACTAQTGSRRLGLLIVLTLAGASGNALANTWDVTCPVPSGAQTTLDLNESGSPVAFGADRGGDTGTGSALGAPDALGALLGTPGQPSEAATIMSAFSGTALETGDTVKITGTCVQDVTITTPGLTITNHNGSAQPGSVSGLDGTTGQIEIAGTKGIVLGGLVLGNHSMPFSFASASDQAVVEAHDGASVVLQFTDILNSPLLGIHLERSAQVVLQNSNVVSSGEFGIRAETGSSIVLGTSSDGSGPQIQSNFGGGIALLSGSSLIAPSLATPTSIAGNLNQQLFLTGSSAALLSGVQVDGTGCSAPCGNSIDLIGGSTLRLDSGTTVQTATGQSAIAVNGGSTMLASGAQIGAASGASAVLATNNSVIALAGGNFVCSGTFLPGAPPSCGSPLGTVFEIDHVSTLVEVPAGDFGYAAAAEKIFGNALAQLQSTIDLGQGTGETLAWTTSGSGIIVEQNSSFRLQGGVTVTGKVQLVQGSNGFFNTQNTGTNSVTNGLNSGVTCPFTAIPAAHVNISAGALTPLPTLSPNFISATTGLCLPL